MTHKPTDEETISVNQLAWDEIAAAGDRFYHALDEARIEEAKSGKVRIKLTPNRWVPEDWFGDVNGLSVLCLACGGGQQAPLFAAAGANATVFDLSDKQLQRDREAAARFGLDIATVQGDMSKMTAFDDAIFDLVVNPCSVCYCPEPAPIWQEVYRVLKPGGHFLTGFIKPINYLFDATEVEQGKLVVRHQIPYSDAELPEEDKARLLGPSRPVEFGHPLTKLIGQQIDAGFSIIGFYEDGWGGSDLLTEFIDVFAATRSRK